MLTPSPRFSTNFPTMRNAFELSPSTSDIAVRVSAKAMGSLLPDSNSSVGFRRCLRPTPLERSTENTAAASVDDIMAPSRKA